MGLCHSEMTVFLQIIFLFGLHLEFLSWKNKTKRKLKNIKSLFLLLCLVRTTTVHKSDKPFVFNEL